MVISYEEIVKISFGSINTTIADDGVHFAKCTPNQVAEWYKIRHDLGERAEATTGVKLDFYTDGDAVVFSFAKGRKVEVYIDNLFRGQFLMDEYRAKNEKVKIAITDSIGGALDKKRVTIYFPAHDEPGVIDYLEIENATKVTPYQHALKMLFIGDSITQGWETMTDTLSYAQKVSRHFDAESVINGIGGAIFAERTFAPIDFEPDVVILSYGTNDFGYWQSGEEMSTKIREYMSLIKKEYDGKKIFAISPIWRTDYDVVLKTGTFKQTRERVKNIAESFGFIHIDGLKMIPPFKEYFTDNVHPNEMGFAFYAENLIMQLKKYL
ncbi:MAG: SGNH/GDSL hydrolase family protein [Clostridia bacterium]|nr:SGNH/GDSL hydrolase family protein [Clostridia bacterium]